MLRSPIPRAAARAAALATALAAGVLLSAAVGPSAPDDALEAEIERCRALLRSNRDSTDFWQQVQGGSRAMLERTEQAFAAGARLTALQRAGAARTNLRAYEFVVRKPAAALSDTTGFAAAWRREGDSLRALPAASADRARVLRPAAVRALAETAIPQVRNYYDASYLYGVSTEPRFGWFYMGLARAQREFFDLCVSEARSVSAPEPEFRSIRPELDALESAILGAYRPPLSIDRHPDFIGVSSTLKEARELDEAGLHRGALVRYLLAMLRFAPLRPRSEPIDSAAVLARLDGLEARLDADGRDHSIARLYLETARLEIQTAPAGRPAPNAVAVVTDVLPGYLAAIEPARKPMTGRPAPAPTAGAVVTLVRWPYT